MRPSFNLFKKVTLNRSFLLLRGFWNLVLPNSTEKYKLQFLKVIIWLNKLLLICGLIGFDGYLIFNKDFITEITFWAPRRIKYDENNVYAQRENWTEETLSFLKARASIKENVKISKYFALLLTGSEKAWTYQLLFFVSTFGYFVDQDLNSWSGIFILIENLNF